MNTKKGIKVKRGKTKRFKSKNIKRRGNKISLKAILFIMLLLGISFLGYSVIAPILDVIRHPQKEEPDPSVPIVTTTDSSGSPVVTTEPIDENPPKKQEVFSCFLDVSALASIDALNTALDSIPKVPLQYNAVVVPLKSKGGALNYATALEIAISARSNQGSLALADIFETISKKGFTPVAEINLLEDSIYPKTFGDTSYTLASGASWYDNNPANGGKPWLSPFSTGTKTYLQEVLTEINTAGFTNIILSSACFPPFRPSDLNIVVNPVQGIDRYKAITDLVSSLLANLPESEPTVVVNANDIFNGTADVLKPDILQVPYAIEFNIPSFGNRITIGEIVLDLGYSTAPEKLRTILQQIKELYPTLEYTPLLSRYGLTDVELAECDMIFDEFDLLNLMVK
ncbi:hypothetical protein FACS1894132_11640 [Clostridia bacterium]|nr:hypothetical protein FACS1894132_11640 [Clostridia bacterium]